jgi:ABC-2 type transport system ATP-binding protein
VTALELENVRKSYDSVVAVDDLCLTIPEGQIFGLLGPNGAGKTTTIRMMVGIIMPDSGVVRIFGEPFERRHLRKVGYLPEERGLYRKARVQDLLLYLGQLNGLTRAGALRSAREWAERLELAQWLGRRVEELSKGMQQKVQFIAAMIHQPRFIIMDEPFAGLDPVNTANLMDILLELKRSGRTILFSTHRMDQVEKLCETICLIDRGKSVLQGRLSDLKARFGRRDVRIAYEGEGRFLADNRLVAARTERGNCVELRLAPDADAQELLRLAAANGKVTRFELIEPSLEEIFIEVVGARDGR